MFSRHHSPNGAVDHALESARAGRRYAADTLHEVSDQAGHYARRGAQMVHDGSLRLRDRAHRASDHTVGYIRDEPVKAILIAVAAGAAIAALASLLSRSRNRY